MAHEDRTIVCAVCAAEFTWTSGEQEFFERRGLVHPPRKCKSCRDSGARALGRAKGRPLPAHDEMIGTPAARRRGPVRKPSHAGLTVEAPCSVCGAMAQLPFQPDGIRPVYCRRCFQQRRTTPTGRT